MNTKLPTVMLVVGVLAGCYGLGFPNEFTDKSSDAKSWGEFSKDQVYVLQRPIYVLKWNIHDGWATVFASDPEDWHEGQIHRIEDVPRQVPDSAEALANYPKIRGVLRSGTHVKALKAVDCRWVESNTMLIVMEVLDGPFAGQLIGVGDLQELGKVDGRRFGPNPRYFSPVQQTAAQSWIAFDIM